MGATSGQWKDCRLVTKARNISRKLGRVDKIHETSITSSYNTKHGYSEVTSCTREFFQNLYDHARQGDLNGMHNSLFMRRLRGEHSIDGKALEEKAFTLHTSIAGIDTEVARVQITPTDRGQRTVLAFAQLWDDALDRSHLLLHSKKGGALGRAGGFGEGFKVAANSLLGRFSSPSSKPCNIAMVMNGRTWVFRHKDFNNDSAMTSSAKIEQFVVQEYKTEVYGGMVVFVDVPMPTRWLESIWNPDHYVPTRPLAIWTPLLPFEESPAMSYVHFLEDSNAPSMFFQLGIYIGNVRGSKGAFFNEGGSVNIGRDRTDTRGVLSNIRQTIAKRVALLPFGSTDYDVMERLMNNPAALGRESRLEERMLYESVVSYIRSRDRVPETTEIIIVGPQISIEVTACFSGAQIDMHVVGAATDLWTYESDLELNQALMIKTFTQLSHSEKLRFQAELRTLATIPHAGFVWVLGTWPGNIFQTYAGQSSRFFKDIKSSRNLVPADRVKDQAYFVGLCMDAWVQSGLDPFLFMKEVGPDPGIVRDPNRVASLVLKAREQSASGKGFLVGVKESVDTSRGTSVSTGRGKPNGGFSISSANDPSSRGEMDDEPTWFPPPTLKDPAGMCFGGWSGPSHNIVDSVDGDEETRFKAGPLRQDGRLELFVAEGVSDEEACWCHDRFTSTPGVTDALSAIFLTAQSFVFKYSGVSFGPVPEPVIRLFAASPSCRTLGFNIVNDRALWINISALMRDNDDQRTVVAGLVTTAMH